MKKEILGIVGGAIGSAGGLLAGGWIWANRSGMIRSVEEGKRVAVITLGKSPAHKRDYGPGEGNCTIPLTNRKVVVRAPTLRIIGQRYLQETQTILTTPVEISSPLPLQTTTRDAIPITADIRLSVSARNAHDIYHLDPDGPAYVILRSSDERFRGEQVEGILDQAAAMTDTMGAIAHGNTTIEEFLRSEGKVKVLTDVRELVQERLDRLVLGREPTAYQFLRTLQERGIDRRRLGSSSLDDRFREGGISSVTNVQRGVVVEAAFIESVWEVHPRLLEATTSKAAAPDQAEALQTLLKGVGGDIEAFSTVLQADVAREAARSGSNSVFAFGQTRGQQANPLLSLLAEREGE